MYKKMLKSLFFTPEAATAAHSLSGSQVIGLG
jgi:hypothetical protein